MIVISLFVKGERQMQWLQTKVYTSRFKPYQPSNAFGLRDLYLRPHSFTAILYWKGRESGGCCRGFPASAVAIAHFLSFGGDSDAISSQACLQLPLVVVSLYGPFLMRVGSHRPVNFMNCRSTACAECPTARRRSTPSRWQSVV